MEIKKQSDIEKIRILLEIKQKRIDECEKKNRPKIGIFWIHFKDGAFKIYYSYDRYLFEGYKYGHFIIDKYGHYNYWEKLKYNRIAPRNSNYEDLPRGRVSYNRKTRKYVVYHGNYLKDYPEIKLIIKDRFNLKSNVKWQLDLHYNKFKRWGHGYARKIYE